MTSSPAYDLCVIGFAYFELYASELPTTVERGSEVFVPRMQLRAGGVLNTASVAHALGARTVVQYPAGGGLADRGIAQLLAELGIAAVPWPASADPAISIVVSDAEDRSFISSADVGALDAMPAPPAARWLHAGLLEAERISDALEAARRAGARVSLTGSWAPGVLARLPRVQLPCDCLVLNRREAEAAAGSVDSALDAFGGRIEEVVVTLGTDGAVASIAGRRFEVPAEPAHCIDPTGAGDAFCAGYLAGRLFERTPPEALHLATRAAALQIGQVGGMATSPDAYRELRLAR